MKTKLLGLFPYAAALAADFYLLPCLIKDTGMAMVLMLCVMPLIALIIGVACGVRRGFEPLLTIAAVLLFLPTVFLFYNATAWPYAPVYGALVLAGNAAGRIFYRKR